jgi:hypothetical protein
MKMTDGSEKIRIRTDLAKRVREETERLRISFPEFVHFLITAYFVNQGNQNNSLASNVSAQSFIAANQEEEAEKPEEYSSQEIDDSDDLYEIDIDI